MKRILLVGGGSGGHFYPLIAVAEKLNVFKERGDSIELYYMGPEQYDASALQENNITFVYCPSGKQRKYFSLLNYLDIFKVIYGFFSACIKLYVLYPDVIFSKGSYTSVPVVLAGFFLRIPIVVHESDTKPGSANKLASKFARYIAISFDDTAQYFPPQKTALTGIPLRKVFYQEVENPLQQLGLPNDKPLIFVTGGSFGAQRLNNLILESLDELLPEFVILHQAGTVHREEVENTAVTLISETKLLEHYFVKGSLTGNEMNLAQRASSLIISRAGAGSIFEIARAGKPSILIPIPEKISHDQKTNAYAYARSLGSMVLEEENLTDGLLASEIHRIMSDPQVYASMRDSALLFGKGDAGQTIAEALLGIANEHTS